MAQSPLYNKTGAGRWGVVGCISLTVNDPRRCPFFFFNDTATTEIYTLSLHDALPICEGFSNSGFGLPVANFMSGGTLVGQARATQLTGNTTLTVPFPKNATRLY